MSEVFLSGKSLIKIKECTNVFVSLPTFIRTN